jgi:hypothetical protein
MTPQEIDAHFEANADVLADLLRLFIERWEATEQRDSDETDNTPARRAFIGYNYATDDQNAHIFLDLFHGPTGKIQVKREGKALHIAHHIQAYRPATITVALDPARGSDFIIDDEYRVHSMGELRDRLLTMWNSNHWKCNHKHITANAEVYAGYVLVERTFRAQIGGVTQLLNKLGKAWEGERQTDNTPDPDDERGGLFGRRGGGKKRYFVGYNAPRFIEKGGQARATTGTLTLDLWEGKKGTINKTPKALVIQHDKGSDPKQITVQVEAGQLRVDGTQASATDARELAPALLKLWKADAFGLRG